MEWVYSPGQSTLKTAPSHLISELVRERTCNLYRQGAKGTKEGDTGGTRRRRHRGNDLLPSRRLDETGLFLQHKKPNSKRLSRLTKNGGRAGKKLEGGGDYDGHSRKTQNVLREALRKSDTARTFNLDRLKVPIGKLGGRERRKTGI